jgi:hypothetical protein
MVNILQGLFPGLSKDLLGLIYLSTYNFFYGILTSIIRMSTFSLVGAVIPVNAAGSLFAGFMSVANLAYSFSYSSGSWLYTNGLEHTIFAILQNTLFGIESKPGDTMSINLLIFIGSMAYLLSLIAVQMLPDKRQTQASGDLEEYNKGPEHYRTMGVKFLKIVNYISLIFAITIFLVFMLIWKQDIIKSSLLSFFITAFIRKLYIDFSYKRYKKGEKNESH